MRQRGPLMKCLFAFCFLALTVFAMAAEKPIKVFILAGQSNMEGQAVVDLDGKNYNDGKGTLVALMKDPAKVPMLQHLRRADGTWTVRDDVFVRYQRERGNAETYFLVGNALGKAMVKLCPAK